ncbi:MAG: hypothetical protein ABI743_09945, partial [bacterium]
MPMHGTRPLSLAALLALLVLILSLSGCSSSGNPILMRVEFFGALERGSTAVARAFETGKVTAWSWTFAEGTEPPNSRQRLPLLHFTKAGTFEGTVVATDAEGASDSLIFSYTIKEPLGGIRILSIRENGTTIGQLGDTITFHAETSSVPTSWDWTFDGGTDPPTSHDAEPSVELTAAGMFTGSLVVHNDTGPSEKFNFIYEVLAIPDITRVWSKIDPAVTQGVTTLVADWSGFGGTWTWSLPGAQIERVDGHRCTVRLGAALHYNGTVSVETPGGSRDRLFTVTAVEPGTGLQNPAPPRLIQLQPLPHVGEPSALVDFRPTIAGSADKWVWEFGGGALTIDSLAPAPRVRLGQTGTYTGWVSLRGATGTSVSEFTYRVGDPPGFPTNRGWASQGAHYVTALGPDGSIFFANVQASEDLDPGPEIYTAKYLHGAGGDNKLAFGKIGPNGVTQWINFWPEVDDYSIDTLAVDATGHCYAGGSAYNAPDIDPGPGVLGPPPPAFLATL